MREGARYANAKTKVEEERHRSLPAHLVICLIIAMSLWSRDSMRDVQKNLIDQTEFRSQEPEWAKRPATANRMEFCATGG
ncbi:transposase domain-containing protein [Nostoc commune]|uniref:transposase domain-containing protein n=1 Tax=Nostoc commune TaxID=1178 RepID=UPI003969DE32